MQAYLVGRQKLFIYVNITVDNWGKLERIVTAALGVSLGVDGRAKEGGGGWGGERFSLLTSAPSLLQLLDSFAIQHGGYICEQPQIACKLIRLQAFSSGARMPIQTIIWDRLLDRFMSCLLAETPLPAVTDQLERHQKELHYPSHQLNVGNSLGQEALGTIPNVNFPTGYLGRILTLGTQQSS